MENVHWLTGIVFPYLNLALFLFLAVKFLKKPMLGAIGSKKQEYLELLKEANKAKEEALLKHEALQLQLEKMDSELEEIKEKAKSQAELEAAKIVESAHALAHHLKQEAKRIAEAEVELARKEIQEEIISSVQDKVVEKIKEQLSAEKQQALFISQVKALDSLGGHG